MTALDNDTRAWHRRVCQVTPWLLISGDLHHDQTKAETQLAEWRNAGVTDIVDLRGEWSDASLVAAVDPTIRYHYLGTHDNGTAQSDTWFDAGIRAMHAARHEGGTLMVHCHMGINRGPSMAFAMMLEHGYSSTEALTMLRDARPIAAMAYAEDALRAHHRRHGTSVASYDDERAAIRTWFSENRIDVAAVIRLLRTAS